jgi:hypothetical protein
VRRRHITEQDVITRIRAACVAAGGQARFARSAGVKGPYLSEVLSGDKPPGPAVLAALGLRKVDRPPVYVPIEREALRNAHQTDA